ncbi:hypothetical protein NKG05_17360 [Oerskovia sp. M15]
MSFSVFTLLGSLLLGALGLPQDLLRWVGLTLLAVIGVGMIVPRFEEVLERPFQKIAALGSRRGRAARTAARSCWVWASASCTCRARAGPRGDHGRGCDGEHRAGDGRAHGVVRGRGGDPAAGLRARGRRVAERVTAFQRHTRGIRVAGGVVMIALAVGLAFNLPAHLQRALPDYTGSLQERVDASGTVREALDLGGIVTDENRELSSCSNGASELEDCGPAPRCEGSTRGSTRPATSPSRSTTCAARSSWSTSGHTPASTASARSRT